MRLRLQGIGIVESADININGITLIAGQNDSGKSTIGKVLYALIRSFNIDKKTFDSSKIEFIQNKIQEIRNLIIRAKISTDSDQNILNNFIDQYLEPNSKSFLLHTSRISEELSTEIIKSTLENIKILFQNHSNEAFKEQLFRAIADTGQRLDLTIDSSKVTHFELESYLENEFGNQIQNKFSSDKSIIEIEIGAANTKVLIEKEIKVESTHGEFSELLYNDVFFIETPLDLNDRKFFYAKSSTLRNKKNYLNYKIFKEKEEQDIFSDTSLTVQTLNDSIKDITQGDFGYNSRNQLVFKKSDIEFELSNVATGLKSFGILQLLIENGSLNSNSLLIIDEPEVHLHPTWQIKYAEILVRLSLEFAIPILLTSHSPYFIEALDQYIKKYNYLGSTSYYFAEKNGDGLTSNFVDVTEDISPILRSISDAFYKIQDINDGD